jgi:uncharacterized membrane-anchored protein
MKKSRGLFLAVLLASAAPAFARDSQSLPEDQKKISELKAMDATLRPEGGDVHLAAANATLHLGKAYYFLNAEDARKVLVQAWGNPPEAVNKVLGLVFPAGHHWYDGSWGAVISFEPTGYVSDETPKPDEYDRLLRQIRDQEGSVNAERKRQGFEPTHLVGWAQPPSYDRASHSMVWARDIKFGEQADDTLNYDVRLLGRSGVLSLNMVAVMSQLPEVRGAAAQFSQTAGFDAGSRYADYHFGDAKAAYGLAGLVAAGLGLAAAKKLGMLALLAVFGKKFFVVIAAALAGLWAKFRNALGFRKKTGDPPSIVE